MPTGFPKYVSLSANTAQTVDLATAVDLPRPAWVRITTDGKSASPIYASVTPSVAATIGGSGCHMLLGGTASSRTLDLPPRYIPGQPNAVESLPPRISLISAAAAWVAIEIGE